jgi:hypothetical protein
MRTPEVKIGRSELATQVVGGASRLRCAITLAFLPLSRSITHQMTSSSSIPGLVNLTVFVQVVKIALFSVLEPLREPRPDCKCPNLGRLGPLLLFRDVDEKEFSEERNHRVNFGKYLGSFVCL